jgi:hypothetical protein
VKDVAGWPDPRAGGQWRPPPSGGGATGTRRRRTGTASRRGSRLAPRYRPPLPCPAFTATGSGKGRKRADRHTSTGCRRRFIGNDHGTRSVRCLSTRSCYRSCFFFQVQVRDVTCTISIPPSGIHKGEMGPAAEGSL